MKKKDFLKRSFTVIEILLIVAIIGFLASVVLTSLNPKRIRARDVRIQLAIKEISPFAELINGEEKSYFSLCVDGGGINTTHPAYGTQLKLIEDEIKNNGGDDFFCGVAVNEYCVYSNLGLASQYFCIDSTGKAGVVTTDPSATCDSAIPSYSCP